MHLPDTVSSERGSTLPFFIGLLSLSLFISIGAAEICSSFIAREAMQQTADQLSLVAVAKKLTSSNDVEAKLKEISNNLSLSSFRLADGQTAEVRVCRGWNEWLKLPGLSPRKEICVNSAAR